MKRVAVLFVLVLAGLAARRPAPWDSRTVGVMHTELLVVARADEVDRATDLALAAFRAVEATANEWKDESPLGRVNRAAGQDLPIPADLHALMARALRWAEATDGAFDPSWAALWGLWRFDREGFVVPEQALIEACLQHVDWRRVRLGEGTLGIEPGMALGLGGIAKGWALDQAGAALRAAGIEHALLSAGGQVLAVGDKGGQPWRVGIRDPRGAPGTTFTEVEVADASVSTSGDYERFVEVDGVRYHHILDPRTGWPARGLMSATVVTRSAADADALSTAAMVLGPDAERVVGGLEGVRLIVR